MHKHTNTQMHKHANAQTTNTKTRKHINNKRTYTQMHKRTNIQTHQHTNAQMFKRTNTQTLVRSRVMLQIEWNYHSNWTAKYFRFCLTFNGIWPCWQFEYNRIPINLKENYICFCQWYSHWLIVMIDSSCSSFFLSSLYPSLISFSSFTFPGAPYRIFLLFLPWIPCHFHLVVITTKTTSFFNISSFLIGFNGHIRGTEPKHLLQCKA